MNWPKTIRTRFRAPFQNGKLRGGMQPQKKINSCLSPNSRVELHPQGLPELFPLSKPRSELPSSGVLQWSWPRLASRLPPPFPPRSSLRLICSFVEIVRDGGEEIGFDDLESSVLFARDHFRLVFGIVKHYPAIQQGAIVTPQVSHSRLVPSSYNRFLHIMSAAHHPIRDSFNCHLGARKPQKVKMDSVTQRFDSLQQGQMSFASKCGFESEGDSPPTHFFDPFDHEPARSECHPFRNKWRKTLREQIRVHKFIASTKLRQKLPCERGFSGPIRPRDHVDNWMLGHCPFIQTYPRTGFQLQPEFSSKREFSK